VNFLLDTNAVSEWVKPRPNPGLIRWMEEADEDRVFLSVISLAELHYGIERMAVLELVRGAVGLLDGFRASFLRGCDSASRPGGFQIASAKNAAGCGGVDDAAVRLAVAVGAQLHEANGSTRFGRSGFAFLASTDQFFF
jgi:hypothetical protein